MNDLNVFVLAEFDQTWPSRVAAVFLSRNKYEAEYQAEDICEKKGWDLEDFEIMPLYEDDEVKEVWVG